MSGERIPLQHYHGDIVRKLFLSGGMVMLVTLPFVQNRLPISLTISILAIMIIDILAGITNPKWVWVVFADAGISLITFLWFTYYTVAIYLQHSIFDILFWTDGVLSVIFFFALYFSTKTARAILEKI